MGGRERSTRHPVSTTVLWMYEVHMIGAPWIEEWPLWGKVGLRRARVGGRAGVSRRHTTQLIVSYAQKGVLSLTHPALLFGFAWWGGWVGMGLCGGCALRMEVSHL